MAKTSVVWVVVDPDDPLDAVLVEVLREELDDDVAVESVTRCVKDGAGVVEVLKGVIGELGGRRATDIGEALERAEVTPAVVVTSSPDDVIELADVAKRSGRRPTRVAVVRSPSLGRRWLRAPADLFGVPDGTASASAGERKTSIRVTGVPVETAYCPIDDAPAARGEQGLDADAHVLLIAADAFEPHELGQLLVQLALVRIELEVLFEVDDQATASELERLARAHGISACLVPAGIDAAPYWSLAHLIVARPTPVNVFRARAAQVPILLAPGRGADEKAFVEGLVGSGSASSVETLATLAVDLDLSLEPQRYEALLEHVRKLSADRPRQAVAALVEEAVEMNDQLQGGARGLPTRLVRISKRKREEPQLEPDRFEEAARAATEVRDQSERWSQRARIARSHGDEELAQEADKRAARHREVLNRLLETMRPDDWEADSDDHVLEEELEALRRRVLPDKPIEARLRSLEVEDELRELKERLKQE